MNPILKYNGNEKYSTKDLKGGYTGNDFLIMKFYLNVIGPPVKSSYLTQAHI